MPDLLEQRGRPFRVTLSVLIESVLKAGTRVQRHLAAVGQPSALFARLGAQQTGRETSNCAGHTPLHSRSLVV